MAGEVGSGCGLALARSAPGRVTMTLTAIALAAGLLAAGVAAAAPGRHRPAVIAQTTCFWTGLGSSKVGIGLNYAFPDTGAVYWSAKFTMPVGSTLVLRGRFAHARYQSLNSYNVATNAPVDALNDVSTHPDPGSGNPFEPGVRRDVRRRAYTVRVLNAPAPPRATRAANTLYAGVSGQQIQELIYRVYLPDHFTRRELTGGVGLPALELRLPGGSVARGSAACAALHTQRGRLALTTLPKALYESLRDQPGQPPTFPAQRTPTFRAYYNTSYSIACAYHGQCDGHPARIGGQYSNVDNNYIGAFVNRGFPAGPVLVLRGKLPLTPRTGPRARRMGRGQMRYWSICQNESLFTTRGAGCVYDAQVPVDRRGYYTIVTSLPRDRPRNAVARCGVAFIPWPAAGDGDGHLNDALLLVRNMLPAPNFHHAVQNTQTPGDEEAVMGPYYPRGTYTTKTAFQRAHRCRR